MPQKQAKKRPIRPAQKQTPPGSEAEMLPQPKVISSEHRGSGQLEGKVALITGADSGIGRATAVLFAREGADVVVAYLSEDADSRETQRLIEAEGRRCLLFAGDLGREAICRRVVEKTVKELGKLDILVNNAAEQTPQESISDITEEQLVKTFRTNIFAYFFMVKAALPHLMRGAVIINTTSVTAYRGSANLIDYSSTKGAIVTFTRALAHSLVGQGIRVNGVAPGPIWTPLIPSTFDEKTVAAFGSDVPMARAGQPEEVAPSFLFLASDSSSYMTGQILHPNGGEIVNG